MSPLDGIIQWALEHSDEILEHRQKRKNRRKYRTSMFYTLPFIILHSHIYMRITKYCYL